MAALRDVKKRLSRCERFLAAGVRAGRDDPAGLDRSGAVARLEARQDREFSRPLADLVTMLRRGGITLPPRELLRLVRLATTVALAAGRPTVTEEAIADAVAFENGDGGTGADAATVTRHAGPAPDLDPELEAALVAELTEGPTRAKGVEAAGEETPGAHDRVPA